MHLDVTPYYGSTFARIFYGVPAETALSSYNAALTGTPGRTDVSPPNGAPAQRDAQRRVDRSGLTVGPPQTPTPVFSSAFNRLNRIA